MKGILISGVSSNSGKTIITASILRLLYNRGIDVRGFKIGPDYIDTAYHEIASCAKSYNIDMWSMRENTINDIFNTGGKLGIIEGVMGLFDGAADGSASSAAVAVKYNLPIILIIDAFGQSQSVCAIINGFNLFDENVKIAGVIFTRIGSIKHEKLLDNAMSKYLPNIKVFGYIYRNDKFEIDNRHLGLVQACEDKNLSKKFDEIGEILEKSLDVDGLLSIASDVKVENLETDYIKPLGKKIAVASDNAFNFKYNHVIRAWENSGSTIHYFSPLNDEAPLNDCDAMFLPGGYPELYLNELSSNHNFLNSVREFKKEGKVIYGECGGYMVMGKYITGKCGKQYDMLGILNIATSFAVRKLQLSYCDITVENDSICEKGNKLRGHEFHYSVEIENNSLPLFEVTDVLGMSTRKVGSVNDNAFGSYIHIIDKVDNG